MCHIFRCFASAPLLQSFVATRGYKPEVHPTCGQAATMATRGKHKEVKWWKRTEATTSESRSNFTKQDKSPDTNSSTSKSSIAIEKHHQTKQHDSVGPHSKRCYLDCFYCNGRRWTRHWAGHRDFKRVWDCFVCVVRVYLNATSGVVLLP